MRPTDGKYQELQEMTNMFVAEKRMPTKDEEDIIQGIFTDILEIHSLELTCEKNELDESTATFEAEMRQYINTSREVSQSFDNLEFELFENKCLVFEGAKGDRRPHLTAKGIDLITTHTELTHAEFMGDELSSLWENISGKLTSANIARLMDSFTKRSLMPPPEELPLEAEQVEHKLYKAPLIKAIGNIFANDKTQELEGRAVDWSIKVLIKSHERNGMASEAAEACIYEGMCSEDIWGTLAGQLEVSALRKLLGNLEGASK